MRFRVCVINLLLLASALMVLWGCKENERRDTVIASAANPSHTYRATIILRQYFAEGKPDNSPTTFVLLDRDTGKPDYRNGEEFREDQVVIRPSQCGTLNVEWSDDQVLKVICEKCGLSLSAVGQHPRGVGSIRIDYEGFPELSSWETGSHAN
jgi:hypothetical protein